MFGKKKEELTKREIWHFQRLLQRENDELQKKRFRLVRQEIRTLSEYHEKQDQVNELEEQYEDNMKTFHKLERMW